MLWEAPLQLILESIVGPAAKIVAVIISMAGLAMAFGDTSGGFRRLIQIVFGLSNTFAESSFFLLGARLLQSLPRPGGCSCRSGSVAAGTAKGSCCRPDAKFRNAAVR